MAKVEKKKQTISELQQGLKRAAQREEYYRIKVRKLEDSSRSTPARTVKACSVDQHLTLEKEAKENKKKFEELQESCEWLESLIEDETKIELFDRESATYTSDCQMCVYSLLDSNVSTNKIGSVMETVMNLAGKTCDKVPSKATIINMNLQRLHLAQQQIGDVLADKESSCLLTDETSRRGKKYMGYEARDMEGKLWVLGMREMATKSASDTLDVFKEILSDIDATANTSSS